MVIVLLTYAFIWFTILTTVIYHDIRYSDRYKKGGPSLIALFVLLISTVYTLPFIACRYDYNNEGIRKSDVINLINWAQSPEAKADVKNALLDGKVTQAERDQIYHDNEQRQIDNFNYGD